MRKTIRNVLAIFLVLQLAGGGGIWWRVSASLPQLDGSAEAPGLSAEAHVTRDHWGNPWIQARSEEDMALAQGYVTTQDRLWQMDLLRRAASGELSEIVGPVALPLDRENRTLGLSEAAERAASDLQGESRKLLQSYARGVNDYIQSHQHSLPVEFSMLGYKPRPWTPADTLLISAYMWKALTTTWQAKLNRAWITQKVGPERAKGLFTQDSPLDHVLVGGTASQTARFEKSAMAARELASIAPTGIAPSQPYRITADWLEAVQFFAPFEAYSQTLLSAEQRSRRKRMKTSGVARRQARKRASWLVEICLFAHSEGTKGPGLLLANILSGVVRQNSIRAKKRRISPIEMYQKNQEITLDD